MPHNWCGNNQSKMRQIDWSITGSCWMSTSTQSYKTCTGYRLHRTSISRQYWPSSNVFMTLLNPIWQTYVHRFTASADYHHCVTTAQTNSTSLYDGRLFATAVRQPTSTAHTRPLSVGVCFFARSLKSFCSSSTAAVHSWSQSESWKGFILLLLLLVIS